MLALVAIGAASHTPVIAIISHPTLHPANDSTVEGGAVAAMVEAAGSSADVALGKWQYMPASYVKWLELAGARVMPLNYHATDAEVDAAFAQINGALFMGGGATLPPAARRLWAKATEANAAGDVFPIWGSCLGFEWLMQLGAEDDKILANGFDSENLTLPLNLTAAAARSRLLGPAASTPVPFAAPPLTVLDALTKLPVTMNNHQQGVTPAGFAASAQLSGAFTVLSTNTDRQGRAFVSTAEHQRMPVWATQWHPEKNIFEQGAVLPTGYPFEVVQHTHEAVVASQYLATFFVHQARRSKHRFASAEEEWGSLIYKYTTSQAMAPAFEQVYYFKDS